MQRVILTGNLSAGGNASRTLIATADLRENHAAAVMWLTFSCSEAAGCTVRAVDNNTNLSAELFVGEEDVIGTIVVPMPHPNIPWVLGPVDDGLEVYLVGEHSAGTARYTVTAGIEQFNINVLEERTEIPEVP